MRTFIFAGAEHAANVKSAQSKETSVIKKKLKPGSAGMSMMTLAGFI